MPTSGDVAPRCVDDGKGTTTSRGFRLKDVSTKPAPTCPSATGAIDLDQRFGLTTTASDTFGSQRVRLGQVREAMTAAATTRARAQMGPDARLQPFTLSIDLRYDHARSGSALAFFSARTRAVGTARLTATVSPDTGALSGASLATTARLSGFDREGAKTEAEFRAMLEKMLRDEAGRVQAEMKKIESKARSGGCTRLVFTPGSPAQLAPKASKQVAVRLETTTGKVTVTTVRWAAVAAKGSVSPGTSKAPEPRLAVKVAAKGPQTALVSVKAVSPAGISQARWIGVSKDEAFPLTYRGNVTLTSVLPTYTETWLVTATFRRTDQQTNPDETKQALYELASASVDAHTGQGMCRWSTSDSSPTIKAGDIEIQVDAAGTWTSAFLVDLLLKSTSISCPPAPTMQHQPKSFLSSRIGGSGLRPMEPRGPIRASSVSDVGGMSPTASWSLSPGS